MTIKEALNLGVRQLAETKTHDPLGSTSFLLRHVLERNSTQSSAISFDTLLLTDPDLVLSTEDLELYQDMLEQRRRHEPVWYITNAAYFWKDTFHVDERVLIPRPETELLVETVLEYLSRLASHESRFSIADVGTGSGAIALSLAGELPRCKIFATDISADAIEVAKLNAQRLGLLERIEWLIGDALEPLKRKVGGLHVRHDLIVGNPPYIPTETIGGLAYDIHHFEPRVAIDGGPDGLDIHRKILSQAPKILKKGGAIFLEIGHDQGKVIKKIARRHFPSATVNVLKDYSGHDRIVRIFTWFRRV